MPAAATLDLRSSRWWFVLIVGTICIWVFSLPVFPSQDGPMHRYYAHALGAVLTHQSRFDVYAIRRPFPPYATQYLSLLGLFHFFSFDLAEKLLVVTEIVCFACGLRLCATAVGPSGSWVSLLVAPLLLPWYLLMGFFNYSIGLGVALLTVACWLRMERSRWAVAGFGLCALVLIFSHPVPVLLLLAFEVLDLLRRRFFMPAPQGSWWKYHSRLIGAFLYTVCLAVYPSLAIDKTQTANTLSDAGFHLSFVRTVLLLTGLSPYNSRSHDLWINGYRLACYGLLLLASLWSWQAWMSSRRTRSLPEGAAFAMYALLFALLLPFLPDHLNGGVFFATRMVILVWVFALLGAAGRPDTGRAFHRTCLVLGFLLTALTLAPAERKLRPIARSVRSVEAIDLPAATSGLLLTGPTLTSAVRMDEDLAFDPYLWANVLPLVGRGDLVLDAPWLQLSVSPLRPANGAPELADVSVLTDQAQADPPASLATLFPSGRGESAIQQSRWVMYAGTEQELAAGLLPYLGAQDAAAFTCSRVTSWSLACFRTTHD